MALILRFKYLQISKIWSFKIIYVGFRCTICVIKLRQIISDNAKRLDRCYLLLCSFRNKTVSSLSNVKWFTVKLWIRKSNEGIHKPRNVFIMIWTKFPASLYARSVVSNKCDIKPPYIFRRGENVTKEIAIVTTIPDIPTSRKITFWSIKSWHVPSWNEAIIKVNGYVSYFRTFFIETNVTIDMVLLKRLIYFCSNFRRIKFEWLSSVQYVQSIQYSIQTSLYRKHLLHSLVTYIHLSC